MKTIEILDSIKALASLKSIPVAAVGGMVRDRILGIPSEDFHDIDVVIEGDAIVFAQQFAAQHQGTVQKYLTFSTATVTLPQMKQRVDFSSARTEVYKTGGALPTVTWATIAEDLSRRDFSINAIAQPLSDFIADEESYFDPENGIQACREKRIAILHARSFMDDPTRLFRAIRYAARLGFRFDERTEAAFHRAVEGNALGTISLKRIFTEIQKIVSEESFLDSFEMMESLGLVHGSFEGTSFKDLDLQPYAPPERFLRLIATLVRSKTETAKTHFYNELNLSKSDREMIARWEAQ